jgi:hypothetical protein
MLAVNLSVGSIDRSHPVDQLNPIAKRERSHQAGAEVVNVLRCRRHQREYLVGCHRASTLRILNGRWLERINAESRSLRSRSLRVDPVDTPNS